MITLLSSMPQPENKEQAILLALGDFYGLTIPQVMELYGWKSYERTTEAFKRITSTPTKPGLIYRIRRHGAGKDTLPGDVYVLLTTGAHKLQSELEDCNPTFSFDLNKAKQLSPGAWTHTLLVNSVLTKLKLFAASSPLHFRLEGGTHERSMRNEYKDAFKLYPDGVIKFLIRRGNHMKHRMLFLEVERTSAESKSKWQMKVRQYINLFEYKLQTYFQTNMTFVLVLVTVPEFVYHLVHWTEEVLTEMGKEEYRTWFCIGHLDLSLTPAQFFCLPRFYKPFEDEPREVFDGLVSAHPPVSRQR